MIKIRFSPEALTDLAEIKTYIHEELGNEPAANRILAGILTKIKTLSLFPESGVPLASVVDLSTNYRYLVCGSYLVFYRYECDAVSVSRVLYGRRNFMQILFGDASD